MYQNAFQPPANHGAGLAIRFDTHPVKDEDASTAAGHPVYRDEEFIRIVVPGDRNTEVHRPVRAEDKVKFRAQYEDWKRGLEQRAPGIPLTEWPGLSPSQVETLRYAHITTVEQLSEVSDQNLSKLGMGYEMLRQRARDYIAAAKGMAPLDDLRKKYEEQSSHLAMALKQMEDLRRELDAMKQGSEDGRVSRKPRQQPLT